MNSDNTMNNIIQHGTAVYCAHCGEDCGSKPVTVDAIHFCCEGCKTVYTLLQEHNLCEYYAHDDVRIQSLKNISITSLKRYAFLDDPIVADSLLEFKLQEKSQITLTLPSVHCASCVWLLEKLPFLHAGIIRSSLQLAGKHITILFDNTKTSLRSIVELLVLLGYEPDLSMAALHKKHQKSTNRTLYIQLAIAGFAFGNTMLFSLPGYFDANVNAMGNHFHVLFAALNMLLTIPVFLISAQPFFKNAWSGIRSSTMNLDIPIAMGIIAIYSRSVYEIVMGYGPGFMDSFSGLVFFLLVGRLFQKKSFDALEFDRDYTSYLPLQCTVIRNGQEHSISASSLKAGDTILVRNQEIIPADAKLISGAGHVDYSFITGESTPVEVLSGMFMYAGAKVLGPAIEVEVIREVSRSALLRMWNNTAFQKTMHSALLQVSAVFGKYFTIFTIGLALIAALLYLPNYPMAISVFSAVLIISCPCALTLAAPFTLGNIMRISAKKGLFYKNPETVLELAAATSIIFDKTGTLTSSLEGTVEYTGAPLTNEEAEMIISGCLASTHPKSRMIAAWLSMKFAVGNLSGIRCDMYSETPGQGWTSLFKHHEIQLGSAEYVLGDSALQGIQVCIDGEIKGSFTLNEGPRTGIISMIKQLWNTMNLRTLLVSGDSSKNANHYAEAFPNNESLFFNKRPQEKTEFVRALRKANVKEKIIMIGDGLNDAGALMESNVGIAVTEKISSFTPGCDAVMSADALPHLDAFIRYARSAKTIIIIAFWVSVMYNSIGLTLAVMGLLSPVYTAILMPISSLTVIGLTMGLSSWYGKSVPSLKQD